jgi:hypothetical protein
VIRCRRCGWLIQPGEEYETTDAGSPSGANVFTNHAHKQCFQTFLAGVTGVREEEAAPTPRVGRS